MYSNGQADLINILAYTPFAKFLVANYFIYVRAPSVFSGRKDLVGFHVETTLDTGAPPIIQNYALGGSRPVAVSFKMPIYWPLNNKTAPIPLLPLWRTPAAMS